MRFSVALPHPSGGNDPAEIEGYVRIAQAVERAGLDACWATDHPFPYVEQGKAGHQALDPFVLLAYVAAATERLKLHLNLVVVPYRNPFLTARLVASLDVVSGGRVIAGVGAGYMRGEFDALGVEFEARAALVDEGITAMKAAWTGEPVELRTSRYSARGNTMRPVPVSRPHPPLWRGGNTRQAIESAITSCDGWMPFEVTEARSKDTTTARMGLDVLPGRLASLREASARAGRVAPLEVCLVRPFPVWLQQRERAIEELQHLRDLDVGWVAPLLAGREPAEVIENVDALAEIAAAAGVGEKG